MAKVDTIVKRSRVLGEIRVDVTYSKRTQCFVAKMPSQMNSMKNTINGELHADSMIDMNMMVRDTIELYDTQNLKQWEKVILISAKSHKEFPQQPVHSQDYESCHVEIYCQRLERREVITRHNKAEHEYRAFLEDYPGLLERHITSTSVDHKIVVLPYSDELYKSAMFIIEKINTLNSNLYDVIYGGSVGSRLLEIGCLSGINELMITKGQECNDEHEMDT